MIRSPEEMYNEGNIKTDMILSQCSQEMIYFNEYINPIMKLNPYYLDLNFSIPLPFRDINLSFESDVSF